MANHAQGMPAAHGTRDAKKNKLKKQARFALDMRSEDVPGVVDIGDGHEPFWCSHEPHST